MNENSAIEVSGSQFFSSKQCKKGQKYPLDILKHSNLTCDLLRTHVKPKLSGQILMNCFKNSIILFYVAKLRIYFEEGKFFISLKKNSFQTKKTSQKKNN